MPLPLMREVEQVLRWFVAIHPRHIRLALVGGVAVSARTETASTTDIRFLVSLPSDLNPENYLSMLKQRGFAETGRASFVPAGPFLIESEEDSVESTLLEATVQQHRKGPGVLASSLPVC